MYLIYMYTQVDIVVGTPGRLEDLISTGKLALHQCRFFVLDEAVSRYMFRFEKIL